MSVLRIRSCVHGERELGLIVSEMCRPSAIGSTSVESTHTKTIVFVFLVPSAERRQHQRVLATSSRRVEVE
jgi:hypothetical protein